MLHRIASKDLIWSANRHCHGTLSGTIVAGFRRGRLRESTRLSETMTVFTPASRTRAPEMEFSGSRDQTLSSSVK